MEPVRWVGFDMDECIGCVMPLFFPLTYIDPKKEIVEEEDFVKGELMQQTYVLRSSFIQLLFSLWRAFLNKKIAGAFVLSNNGSEPLVQFITRSCNYILQKLFGLETPPSVFRMGISAESPIRFALGPDFKYIKSFLVVQHCLLASGLPPCSSESDLLFFDDQIHVLQSEIPHYHQVTQYKHITPIDDLSKTLHIDTEIGKEAIDRAKAYEKDMVKEGYTMMPPPFDAGESDQWRAWFRKFLNPTKTVGGGLLKIRTRRRNHVSGPSPSSSSSAASSKTRTIRKRLQAKRGLLGYRHRK